MFFFLAQRQYIYHGTHQLNRRGMAMPICFVCFIISIYYLPVQLLYAPSGHSVKLSRASFGIIELYFINEILRITSLWFFNLDNKELYCLRVCYKKTEEHYLIRKTTIFFLYFVFFNTYSLLYKLLIYNNICSPG
jgi:hypothetical protein